jgi:DNA transposition AAA+ family ATPase
MKKHFVKTTNFLNFLDGIQTVEDRGAAEASMMLVFGNAGYGKSETLDHWATQNDAIYLRANVDWTPKYFLIELAKFLKTDSSGTSEQLFARLLAKIAGEQIPVVIDEADHCLHNNASVLEKVRDFADRTETLVILAGMEKIQGKIARHPQISSRIAAAIEFTAAGVDDTRKLCDELCEVQVELALVQEIQRSSAGRVREIMNAIAVVERIGLQNGGGIVTLADVEGKTLTHDWQARRPRVVRIAAGGR